MLHFFRKYQKFFFLLITCVTVITFVFFGTYQAMAPTFRSHSEDKDAYVKQMVQFLNTEQWMVSQKVFASNFLNDGVLSKEFFETGLAAIVAKAYPEEFEPFWVEQLQHEKNYLPYTHPYLPSVSAMGIWAVFAPDLPVKLKAHQDGNGSFKERNELFLAQKQFPPAFISQVIRYQEQNHPNFPRDPRLAREDVSLFGYHDISQWYGEPFVTKLATIIMQTADVARKLGYKVTKDEVLSELVLRAQETYKELKAKMNLPVSDGYGLFQLYLQQNGMREETAIKIWEEVTLFKRLMHAVGSAALTDSLALSQFYAYAFENATIELYQMPAELRFQSLEDLKKFEVYLAAVSEKRKNALDVPLVYAPIQTIETHAPELVGRRYQLFVSKTSKKALQAKVSMKETLQWQCDPQNWHKLQQQFPELAQKTGNAFEILEKMEGKSKKLVDAFARKQIVEDHPEWMQQALVAAEMEEKELFLSAKESTEPFEGIKDVQSFANALDAQDEIVGYTQDGNHFYRFLIQKRGEPKEILTFKEAQKLGILDKLVERMKADALVQAIVDSCPAQFKKQAHAYRFVPFISKYNDCCPEGDLAQQFSVERQEKTLTRSEKSFIAFDKVITMQQGAFSGVYIDAAQGAYLYHLIAHQTKTSVPMDKMVKTQELVSKEARCRYFEKLLRELGSA